MVVLAGWLAVGLLVVATDGILHMMYPNEYVTGKVPPTNLMLISLATGCLYSIFGGWVTARLAANRPWKHIVWLMGWGVLMGVASWLATWGMVPHWYNLTLIVAWPIMVYLGGKTQIRRPFNLEG